MGRMTKEEFREEALRFRAELIEEYSKPEEERGRLQDMDNWLKVEVLAFCQTETCPNSSGPFRVESTVNADGLFRVYCGRCSKQTRKITPVFEDGPGPDLPVTLEDKEDSYWEPDPEPDPEPIPEDEDEAPAPRERG